MVYAGAIYWPIGKARELLRAYRDWVAISPPEMGIEHPPISAIWRAGSTRTPPSPAAKSPEHVQDAVRLAADRRLSIRVQSTGHGALAASTGGMLIDTSTQYPVDAQPACSIWSTTEHTLRPLREADSQGVQSWLVPELPWASCTWGAAGRQEGVALRPEIHHALKTRCCEKECWSAGLGHMVDAEAILDGDGAALDPTEIA